MTNNLSLRGLLAASAGIAATGALSACGSGTPGQKAGSDGGSGSTIEFWHRSFTPVENEWYKQIVKKFNAAQSKVVVHDTEVPADSWEQKMKAAQAAGKAPDVYTHSGPIDDAVNAGQLHTLDDVMAKDKLAEILDTAVPVSKLNDKFYAYPLLLEAQCVLYWNKDMVKKAGLDPEKAPTTWEELLNNMAAVKKTLASGQFAISPASDGATFAWSTAGQLYNAMGHLALNDAWTAPALDDPGFKTLMNTYKTMWDQGYMPRQALAAYVEGKEFGQKKVAYKVGGSWMMSEIGSDYPDMLENTGVGPLPPFPGGEDRTTSTMGNFKWVIDAKSKNAQGAADFISWALAGDPSNLVDFFVKTQFTKVPVRKSVQEAVAKDPGAAKAPWSKIVTDQIAPKAIPEPTYPWDISLAVGTAMESVMKGAASPDQAIQTANAAIDKVIKREKLPEKAPKK